MSAVEIRQIQSTVQTCKQNVDRMDTQCKDLEQRVTKLEQSVSNLNSLTIHLTRTVRQLQKLMQDLSGNNSMNKE